MIPFFRKLRRKLLDERHLGRYLLYALGEVLLVMVGILLALQVDNWNEERKERREEVELLAALRTDLIYARNEMDTVMSYNKRYLNGYRQIYTNIREDRAYDTLLDKAFGNLDVWAQPYLSTMTYETIKNRGIDIIQNDSLKRHIMEVYTLDMKSLTDDMVLWEWSFNQNTTQRMMVENIRRDVDGWGARPNNYEALKNNDEFQNFLSILINVRSDNIDYSLRTKEAIEKLIAHIDKELSARKEN